jgi:hypothetical protein
MPLFTRIRGEARRGMRNMTEYLIGGALTVGTAIAAVDDAT